MLPKDSKKRPPIILTDNRWSCTKSFRFLTKRAADWYKIGTGTRKFTFYGISSNADTFVFCILLFNRLHRGEQQHIADGGAVGEQHHQTVHAEAQTARGGQAVLQCVHVVVVHLCLAVGLDGLTLGHLTLKAALLVDGVVQLAEGETSMG